MNSTHRYLVAVLLIPALLLAGCGDTTSPKKHSTPKTSSTTATTAQPKKDKPPAASEPSIIPGTGIAGTVLGDSQGKLQNALGKPTSTKMQSSELGAFMELQFNNGRTAHLDPSSHTLTYIETTNPADQTAANVGVGSTESQVKAEFPSASCDTTDPGICRVGAGDAGGPVTDFFISDGKVTRVVLGFVQD